MRFILGILFIVLVVLLILLLACAIVLAWSIGLGWVLTLFLPFSWFEASLLTLITSAGVLVMAFRTIQSVIGSLGEGLDLDDEWEEQDYAIPASRFYKSESGKTNEAWLRYEAANAIYHSLEGETRLEAQLGERRLQELAIRLADFSIEALKQKSKRRQKVSMSKNALRQQITQAGQKPYDDETLTLTVSAVNEQLEYYPIQSHRDWDDPCDLFD